MSATLVVATGTANTASVLAALRRQGLAPTLSTDPAAIQDAARVVLPGVGAFATAAARLAEARLLAPLTARIAAGRPTLAICLGLQLLAEGSAESPGARGLAVFAGRATRFDPSATPGLCVPQLGWNRVVPGPGCELLREGHAYYANSYRLTDAPAGWAVATSQHGGVFIGALERGAVLACQFHPELSGAYGAALLARWIERGAA